MDIFMAHARHRLIEQQDLRIERQRGGDFERALAAIGQIGGQRMTGIGKADPLQKLDGLCVEPVEC
ncbi:hypothetical protein D3C80_2226020 [compost metagenome]